MELPWISRGFREPLAKRPWEGGAPTAAFDRDGRAPAIDGGRRSSGRTAALTRRRRLCEGAPRERDQPLLPARGPRRPGRRRARRHGRPRRRRTLPQRHREPGRERRVGAGAALPLRGLPRPLVVPAEPHRQPARAPGVGALPPLPRRRRASARARRSSSATASATATTSSPRCCSPTRDGRWLQRSRTHQSFLVDDPARRMVVDRDREKRTDRRFTLPAGDGEAIALRTRTITLAMCEAFSGPSQQLPHRPRDGAGARLPRHRRAGNDVGLLRRRPHDAALRRRLPGGRTSSTCGW